MGDDVIELARSGLTEAAGALYMGLQNGPIPRNHRPPRGGESPNDVAERAANSLRLLLQMHGKDLEKPPAAFVNKVTTDTPNALPDGIPHVVVATPRCHQVRDSPQKMLYPCHD